MPNHITTIVHIESRYEDEDQSDYEEQKDKIQRLWKKLHTEDRLFNFNGITPMPQEVKDLQPDYRVFDTQEEVDAYNKEWQDRHKNIIGVAKFGAITRNEEEKRTEKYGIYYSGGGIFRERAEPAIDWYKWALKYWGTKWNAYDVVYLNGSEEDEVYGEMLIKMETAWSPPTPILEKLAEDFDVRYTWKDEGSDDWHNWIMVEESK